jgi:hypothetical protein
MWKLPSWYGTCLVCLSCSVLVALNGDVNTYHTAGFLLASLLHINAIVLLYGLETSQHDSQVNSAAPSGSKDTESAAGDGDEDSKDSATNFVPMPEHPHESDYSDENYHRVAFPCCCCSLYYSCFFVFTTLLSTILFLVSLHQEFYYAHLQRLVSRVEWKRSLFLVTFGLFVAASMISWCKRYLPQRFRSDSATTHGDGKLRLPRNIERGVALLLSLVLALVSLFVTCWAYRMRSNTSALVIPFVSSANNRGIYQGEAHVTGYTILNDDWCEHLDDFISVNVSIAWGGSWACPNTPNTYCETVINTKVSCVFSADDDEVTDESYGGADSYVNFRYHADYSGDDDAYDDRAFDYDPDSPPTGGYWNRPSEGVLGVCGTCEARSRYWMTDQLTGITRSSHTLFLSFGVGLCFLGWSLWALWREIRRLSSSDQLNVDKKFELSSERNPVEFGALT